MKTKTYTKHKKNAKNDEWEKSEQNCTMPIKSARLKKESQLDRIERKLDELLSRAAIITPPGQWSCPRPIYWPNPPETEPDFPRDVHGHPIPYGVTFGGAK